MNTVSARYYFYILSILEDMGLSPDSISDIVPMVKDRQSVTIRLSIDDLKILMNRAERELSDEHIGLLVSQQFRIAGYANVGEIYSACENAEQALEMSFKYARLAHNIGKFEKSVVSEEHSITKYSWHPSFSRTSIYNYRHIIECIITNYIQTIKWLTWEFGDCVKGVSFEHSAREPLDEYRKVMGCDPIFRDSETAILLKQDIMERPLSTANPVKRSMLEKKLNQMLAKYNMESDLIARTKYALHEIIRSQRPTIEAVAQELSLSERTFKRYLASQSSQYQLLLQEVKMELFDGYVKEGLPYSEIAQLLWYHDQSALTRAYKKWHGVSPTQHDK